MVEPLKFRKKPVVIEAMQFDGTALADIAIATWVGEFYVSSDVGGPKIKTLEGDHYVSDGDWIIKGVKGEFYPCKPDIFELTYESA